MRLYCSSDSWTFIILSSSNPLARQLWHWKSSFPKQEYLRRRAKGSLKFPAMHTKFPSHWPSVAQSRTCDDREEKSKEEKAVRNQLSSLFTVLFFFLSLLCLSLDKCEKSILGNNHVFYDISFCAVFFFFHELPRGREWKAGNWCSN